MSFFLAKPPVTTITTEQKNQAGGERGRGGGDMSKFGVDGASKR